MSKKKIEWGKEIAQTGSEIADAASDVGIPGMGLVARFAQRFYDSYLQKRFAKFIEDAEIDEDLIEKITTDEDYSNCFYAILETVRQTNSRLGLIALALIYKDHWNNSAFLISAARSFSQINDKTVESFIVLFEEIASDKNYLYLTVQKDGEGHFHDLYNEAVELIGRNFFVMSTGTSMVANGPVQGMKWDHTDSYYAYCKAAKDRV